MRRVWLWCVCWLALAVLAQADGGDNASSTIKEVVRTEDGAVTVWHRTPAREDDLRMPIFTNGLVMDSFVYRVRDRKQRDLLRYTRVSITTTVPTGDLAAFYRRALGADVTSATEKETGVITLASGAPEDFRLVTVTPRTGGASLRLEHTQRFSVPPRVFTEAELRAVRILDDIAAAYQGAQHIAYTITQEMRAVDGETNAAAPTLRWAFDFTRPDHLTLAATMGPVKAFTVTTGDRALSVTRQNADTETRAFDGKITSALLPEIADEPVTRLALDGGSFTDGADYLAVLSLTNTAQTRLAEVVITYPERDTTLFLSLDLRAKLVLRSEIETGAGHNRMRMVRTYADIILDAVHQQHRDTTPSPQPPQPDVPAAVHGL